MTIAAGKNIITHFADYLILGHIDKIGKGDVGAFDLEVKINKPHTVCRSIEDLIKIGMGFVELLLEFFEQAQSI